VSGVSVPMMLKAMTYRELPAHELRERLADCVAPNCAALEPPA
jgi:mannose/fructose-specific phosphotransferase system component IIA